MKADSSIIKLDGSEMGDMVPFQQALAYVSLDRLWLPASCNVGTVKTFPDGRSLTFIPSFPLLNL